MRIGIMLRHFNQHEGGVKVYTRELLNALLANHPQHEFVLMYREAGSIGAYAAFANAIEIALESKSIVHWDHVLVPRAIRAYGIDVLFNPKYSIPLRAGCPTAWVCHGLDWYVMPEASRWIDRLNHRFLIPQYARRSDAVIAVSDTARDHVLEFLPVPPERLHRVYPGLSDDYHRDATQEALEATRRRYDLPARFLMYCGAVYPPKNFTRIIRAYAQVGPARGVPLVIAGGSNRFLSAQELHESQRLGIASWIRHLGWVDNRSLPSVYALAEGLLMPSLYESVGMPIMEAMASGCPVLTSDRYGTLEMAGDAALTVDPMSIDAIAQGAARLLDDAALRTRLQTAGKIRAQEFTWRRTASEVMTVLESIKAPAKSSVGQRVAEEQIAAT